MHFLLILKEFLWILEVTVAMKTDFTAPSRHHHWLLQAKSSDGRFSAFCCSESVIQQPEKPDGMG